MARASLGRRRRASPSSAVAVRASSSVARLCGPLVDRRQAAQGAYLDRRQAARGLSSAVVRRQGPLLARRHGTEGGGSCEDGRVWGGDVVRRLDLGYFIRPAEEAGGTEPRVEPVLGYLVRRGEGLILFDTGIGDGEPEVDAWYRPRRRPLEEALADAGATLADIGLVVNCHLHFDHCGGNPLLAGTPILVQATELATARAGDYTLDRLIDFPGARYEEIDGEAEVWPGVWIIPTTGHTDGHQSLVVRLTDGTVVLAGQAHDFASQYDAVDLARRAVRDGAAPPLPVTPSWHERLARFDPRRVLFAHDRSAWEPDAIHPT
ncbi:MAG: MBL fold metallo-hydrolase [Streptosporangiales bacterium]|nr:MBL fold metallo-hydrolase [Streptosporangiales bacterium]